MKKFLLLLFVCLTAYSQNPNTAVFPGAVAADSDMLVAKDRSSSTLSSDIDDSTVVIPVVDASAFTDDEIITIGYEQMKISGVGVSDLTVYTRGFDWTVAAAHSSGDTVRGQVVAYAQNQASVEIIAIETALGASLALVEAESDYSGIGACAANQWASTLNDDAAPTCTQPAFTDISGTAVDGQVPAGIARDSEIILGRANMTTAGRLPYVSAASTVNENAKLFWHTSAHGLKINEHSTAESYITSIYIGTPVFNSTFGEIYASGASDAPYLGLASYVRADAAATGTGGFVSTFGVALANANSAEVWGANFIASSAAALTTPKLVGLEVDLLPASGVTVATSSVGLIVNAYNENIPGPAIQLGGSAGGSWNIGLLLGGIKTSGGVGVLPNGAVTMDALIHTGVAATYNLGGVVLAKSHEIRWYDDNSSNYFGLKSQATQPSDYTADWAITGNCNALTSGGKLTIDGSNQIACANDTGQTLANDQGGAPRYCAPSGASDTYTCLLTPTLASYTTGMGLVLNPDVNNTGATTLNVDSRGAKAIKVITSGTQSDPGNDDIDSDGLYWLIYDGTVFIMYDLEPAAASGDHTMQVDNGAIGTEGQTDYTTGTGITLTGGNVPGTENTLDIALNTATALTRATDQAGTDRYCASADGSDTYTCTLTPTLTAYTTGQPFILSVDTNNTGAATINIDTVGAKTLKKMSGGAKADLANNNVDSDGLYQICYDGTDFIVIAGIE